MQKSFYSLVGAFCNTNIEQLDIPEGVVKIGNNGIYYGHFKTVNLPKSIKIIDSYINEDIKKINYAGTKEEWEKVEAVSIKEYLSKVVYCSN